MIRIDRDPSSGVTTILLNRPAQKNALTPPMLDQLRREIDALSANNNPAGRAILLAGEGDCFCAGFDLALCRDDDSVLPHLLTGLSRAIVSLRDQAMPVIIAAHGAAIAGGCALLGGGDIVVTDHKARIGYPVVRLGISPAVSAPFLRLSVGDGATRERQLSSALINGRDALRIGLAHESLPNAADVRPRARTIARELAAKPPAALAATRGWLREIELADDARAGHPPDRPAAQAALNASLSLCSGIEQKELLAKAWSK